MLLRKCAIILMFITLIVIGSYVIPQQGISWDEPVNLEFGKINYEYIVGNRPLPDDVDRNLDFYHAPIFHVASEGLIRILNNTDSREKYLLKHWLTFLYFSLALIFFFKLCELYFGSWKWALWGVFFFVLTPPILGHAFFNPKDIPFLSSFIIASFSMYWFFQNPTSSRALLHGLACAICITNRVLGVFLVFMTCLFWALDLWRERRYKELSLRLESPIIIFLAACIALTFVFWPFLWSNVIERLQFLYKMTFKFHWPGSVLYFGEYILAKKLPWHYLAVWISITIPLSVLLFFVLGAFKLPKLLSQIFYNRSNGSSVKLLPYVWFFVPTLAFIVFRPVIYDGWRHFYYIFPGLVMIAVIGFKNLWSMVGNITIKLVRRPLQIVIVTLVTLNLGSTLLFITRNTPHFHVYFNELVGGISGADGKFEMDYWGLSYRHLLESILSKQPINGKILVNGGNVPAEYNLAILTPQERSRVVWLDVDPESVKQLCKFDEFNHRYYLSEFRFHPQDRKLPYEEIAQVTVDGVPISVAFKIPISR